LKINNKKKTHENQRYYLQSGAGKHIVSRNEHFFISQLIKIKIVEAL
jgi:hypothetical protein